MSGIQKSTYYTANPTKFTILRILKKYVDL